MSTYLYSIFLLISILSNRVHAVNLGRRTYDSQHRDLLLKLPRFLSQDAESSHVLTHESHVATFIREIVNNNAHFEALDPTYRSLAETSFYINTHTVHDSHHVRLLPRIDGYPVYNADRVFSIHRRSGEFTNIDIGADLTLNTDLSWDKINAISVEDALDKIKISCGQMVMSPTSPGDSISSLKFVKDTSSKSEVPTYTADKVYFAENSVLNEIRPAWRVINFAEPVLDRHIWYIDAATSNVLASRPTVSHARALVYQFDSAKKPNPPSSPFVEVDVPNVLPKSPFNDGIGVYGRDFRVMNTCFGYTCSKDSVYGQAAALNGTCNENEVICVDITPNMVEGKDFFTTSFLFTTNGKYIDLERNWDADGYINGTIYMKWDRAAIMAPRSKPNVKGLFNADIDPSRYTGGEKDDSFIEFQALYFADLQMQFFKRLTGDTNFCLIGSGPNCTTTDIMRNRTGTPLDVPMKIVTNLQSLRSNPSPHSPYKDLFTQLYEGKGRVRSDPIMFRESEPYGDAFYSNSNQQIPGLFLSNGSDIQYEFRDPRDCRNGNCLSTFSTMYDFIAFGQNDKHDWALNDCIVFHEATHALIGKMIPELPSYVWTTEGLSSDPGSMNEAWADYFAAANCGLADFRKSYHGRPLRAVQNTHTCKSTVGEVHTDGQIFSGALWAVRSAIPTIPGLKDSDKFEYDKIILTALSQGQPTDLFATQLHRVQKLLQTHSLFSKTELTLFASQEFDKRVFECTREIPYDDTMDTTFVLPTAMLTSANLSTIPMQLVFHPRASDWGFKIEWKQWYNSPVLGQVDYGYARAPLKVLISFDCAIQFLTLNGSSLTTNSHKSVVSDPAFIAQSMFIQAQSKCANQTEPIHIPWKLSGHNPFNGKGSLEVKFSPSQYSKVYVWFAHQIPASIVMQSTQLIWYGWSRIWLLTQIAIGGSAVLILCVIGAHQLVRKCKIQKDKTPSQQALKSRKCCVFKKTMHTMLVINLLLTAIAYCGILTSGIVGLFFGQKLTLCLALTMLGCVVIWILEMILIGYVAVTSKKQNASREAKDWSTHEEESWEKSKAAAEVCDSGTTSAHVQKNFSAKPAFSPPVNSLPRKTSPVPPHNLSHTSSSSISITHQRGRFFVRAIRGSTTRVKTHIISFWAITSCLWVISVVIGFMANNCQNLFVPFSRVSQLQFDPITEIQILIHATYCILTALRVSFAWGGWCMLWKL